MASEMRARSLFAWMAAGHFANDCAPGAVWLVAPAAAIAFGYGPAEVGTLIAISSIGGSLGYLPAGILADRVSDQGRLLWLSCVWVAVGYGLASMADGYWMLAAMLALANFGDSAWHPVATGVLVRARPGRRAEALGIHAIGGTLSQVAAPLAVGVLIALFDWRFALACAAIPAAIMAVAFVRVRHAVPTSSAPKLSVEDLRAMARRWSKPAGLALIATISIYNMADIAAMAMLPLFLTETHGFTADQNGVAFAMVVLLGALAQPAIGKLSDRVGRKPIAVTGTAVGSLAAFVVWQSGDALWLALAGFGVAAVGLHGIRSVMLASAVEYAGQREATTLGVAFSVMDGIGALGAFVAGMAGAVRIEDAFLAAAVLSAMAAGGALTLSFARPVRSGPAAETP